MPACRRVARKHNFWRPNYRFIRIFLEADDCRLQGLFMQVFCCQENKLECVDKKSVDKFEWNLLVPQSQGLKKLNVHLISLTVESYFRNYVSCQFVVHILCMHFGPSRLQSQISCQPAFNYCHLPIYCFFTTARTSAVVFICGAQLSLKKLTFPW